MPVMPVNGGNVEDKQKERQLDLSVPQVAGSAVAAVVAAKLTSQFGVYGTILGAGVVSALATCGGSIFQHLFRRTGEQIRGVATQAKPTARAAAGSVTADAGTTQSHSSAKHAADRTQILATVGDTNRARRPPTQPHSPQPPPHAPRARGVHGEAQPLGGPDQVRALTSCLRADASDATRHPRSAPPPQNAQADPLAPVREPATPQEAYTTRTVYKAEVHRWKRPLAASALVFGLTISVITMYEVVSGANFSTDGKGTTIGHVLTGGGSSASQDVPSIDNSPTPPDASDTNDQNPRSQSPPSAHDNTRDRGEPSTPTPEPSRETPTSEPSRTSSPDTGPDPETRTGDGSDTASRPPQAPSPTPLPSQTDSSGGSTDDRRWR